MLLSNEKSILKNQIDKDILSPNRFLRVKKITFISAVIILSIRKDKYK